MRILRSAAGLTFALLIAASLGGCTPPPRHVIPTSEPSVKPVFKSDAEALAAAEKAFKGYLATSDLIVNDGGRDPYRIRPWVTKKWLPSELKPYKSVAESGRRLVGTSSFSHFALQQYQSDDGDVVIEAYACDEVEGIRVVDATGKDVTPSDRQESVPLELEFVNSSAQSRNLIVNRSRIWSGTDYCSN
jgi:hypothetical protein